MKKEVLIVDDNPGIQALLQEILGNEGYGTMTASTGKKAVELLHSNMFDAIILDYTLPILNGVEVLHIMEENAMHIPTIMITGMVESVQYEMAEVDIDVKMLAKPFRIEDVCTVLQKLLTEDS